MRKRLGSSSRLRTHTRIAIVATISLAWSLGVPLRSRAQNPAGAEIVLPAKLVTGQRATLAVLTSDGRLTPGAVVEFTGSQRVTTDVTGRATFAAPSMPGVLLAQLPGTDVSASTTVIAPPPKLPDGVQVDEVPRVISLRDRFAVGGYGFRGEADADRAFLGDQPALVLAASPVALVILAGPRSAPGPSQLVVEVGGRSPGPVPVTLVALELNREQKQLALRERGKLLVRVRGTEQPLEIEARNLTPDVVKLVGGNVQRAVTRGGADNEATLELEGRRAGDFAVSVRLVPPAMGLPDLGAAREQLLAARRVAPGGWGTRLDRLIRLLEQDPQNAREVQIELEKMLGEHPAGEFGRLLEAAWRTLLKR